MSKIDQKFIDSLNNFTSSLESVVDLLKEQAKTNPTDVVNQLLENLDAQKLAQICDDVKVIKDNTAKINNNTEKILAEVKAIKSQKEKGMAKEIEGKDKNTVLNGVKTIILIAAGVLAIGLAFKIVGRVDFLSVIALAAATYLMALTFEKIAKIESLTWKKAVLVAIVMVIMAGAILLSGFLLNAMPTMGLMTMITVLIVTVAMTIATYGMAKAVHHIKMADLPKYFLLPIILPLMAAGIVGAGFILKLMPTLTVEQGVSAIMVSLICVLLAFAVSMIAKALTNKSSFKASSFTKKMSGLTGSVAEAGGSKEGASSTIDANKMLKATAVIPLLAMGVVLAGFVLKMMPEVGMKQLIGAAGVGLALVPISFAFMLAAKYLPSDMMKIVKTAAIVPLLAIGIVLASWVFKLMADFDAGLVIGGSWAISLAILPIGTLIWGLDKLKMTVDKVVEGMLGVILISTAIMISSWILSIGKYEGSPSEEWSLQTGLSLLIFGTAVVGIGLIILATGGIGFTALALGAVSVLMIALTIVATSYILPLGNYSQSVPLEWSLQTGLVMTIFGAAVLGLGMVILATGGIGLLALAAGAIGVLMIAGTIVLTSMILAEGSYGTYPDVGWTLGVGLAMLSFGMPALALGIIILASLGLGLLALESGLGAMLLIAATLVMADEILSQGSWGTYPTFEWAVGVGMSLFMFASVMEKVNNTGKLFGMFGKGLSNDDFVAFILNTSAALVTAAGVFNDSGVSVFDTKMVPSMEWAQGVGIALVSFAQVMDIIRGIGGIFDATVTDEQFLAFVVTAASALVEAGKTLSGTDTNVFAKNNYPGKDWAEGVGGGLVAFATTYKTILEIGSAFWGTNIDPAKFIEFIKTASSALIEAGKVLSATDTNVFAKDNYPSKDWADGVGGALVSFATTYKTMLEAGSKTFSADIPPEKFIEFITTAASALVVAGMIFTSFGSGQFEKGTYPNKEWVGGVADALSKFSKMKLEVNDFSKISTVARYVKTVAIIFSTADYTKYPTEEWLSGVANAVSWMVFASSQIDETALTGIDNLRKLTNDIFSFNLSLLLQEELTKRIYNDGGVASTISNGIRFMLNSMPTEDQSDGLMKLIQQLSDFQNVMSVDLGDSIFLLADAIEALGEAINDLSTDKIDSLIRLTEGMQLLSLVDEQKLASVLSVIKDKKQELSAIMDQGFGSIFDQFVNKMTGGGGSTTTKSGGDDSENVSVNKVGGGGIPIKPRSEEQMDELLGYVLNIDKNLTDMAQLSTKESDVSNPENVEGKKKP